ncbi:hypothetical protein HO133_004492 [Letharia lupina]|uniref:Pentatricopeptide repeat-containing protein n=1 Tax=Letharia lupina TaxID=560253 RepID=A0A8H6FKD7_9LECA|nr:uncharacterized protein HO133_004492 [Letharia lupina]KAF6230153.1 hypothetical protein HO133_004492 [Letharia lupina]
MATADMVRGSNGEVHAWYIRQPHPQLRRAFAISRPLLDDSNPDEPKVRWYQQLLPGSTKRRRIDHNNPDAEENDEARWLKRQISQLEDELREMEDPGEKTMIEPLIATLSPEDQQKVRAAIMQEELEEKRKDLEVAEVKRRLAKLVPKKNELEIHWQLPPEQGTYLRTLNTNIEEAAGKLEDQGLRKKLWKSYARCKAALPPFLHLIPEKSWTVLWASHHTMSTNHPQWALHLITLSEDMLSAGKELHIYQRILYIEGLRREGRHNEAISQWQKLEGDLGEDKRAIEEYELLGVRMFASNGDPERAEKIALDYLRPEKSEDSRILIPILSAWAQRGDAIGIKHAWALYLRFKTQVGDNMTMEDYDNISLSLLNAGRADLALAVFKDLMLTGEHTDQGSIELYRKAASLIGTSQSSTITPEDLNKISLTGLIALPRRFQNKFFYASWLKKLLGMGQVDAAATVIELMYERGVRPDSRHLNGIVGAWLRTGNDKDREMAEEMAWAMIHERLDLVNRRAHRDAFNTPDMPNVKGITVPPHLRRTISPANIETFALLLQHYGRRGQDDNVQLMQKCLAVAEIPPNSYFINHLLYVDLRKGQHQSAWERYELMFRKTRPDLETFACLWDCEKAHLDSLLIRAKDRFPGPRRLMSDMMNWYSLLQPGEIGLVREDFSKELYNQIIRCLGQTADLEGLIAALYAMKESFGIYPDAETTRTVSVQVGRLGIGEDKRPRAGRLRKGNTQRRANAARIAQAFSLLAEQREKFLAEAGLDDVQQCDADIQKEEGLFILAEFLRAILRRTTMDEDAVEANIEKAAWEMGVSGVRMEDPLPSYDIELSSRSTAYIPPRAYVGWVRELQKVGEPQQPQGGPELRSWSKISIQHLQQLQVLGGQAVVQRLWKTYFKVEVVALGLSKELIMNVIGLYRE